MKDPKAIRLLSLLAALGLLWVGIDRVFFDKIVGSGPLSWIQRILTLVVGILLTALSVSLFVVAWRGRFPVTAINTNSTKGKLLWHAFCAAPSALVFGFCLVRTTKHFDSLYLTVTLLFAPLSSPICCGRGASSAGYLQTRWQRRLQLNFCGLAFPLACFPSVWVRRCRAGIGLAPISFRDLTCSSGVQ
jgi:hypothetical protein